MNKLAGFLGVLAMVAGAPLAHADFQISVNGINCTPIVVSGSPNGTLSCALITVAPGVTITNLSVTGLQAAGFSEQLGTTLLIQNTTGAAVPITIDLADSNFTSPLAPPGSILDVSGATLNSTTGTNNTFTLTSCVDQSNGLVPPPGVFCSSPAPGMAPANLPLMTTGAVTKSDNSSGTITSLHLPNFSLSQQLVISAAANSNFNVTSSQVLTPVPEPASMLLLGGVLLGVTGLLRKKVARR